MVKITTIITFALFLVGCQTPPVKLRTETVEVFKPILYCPAPKWEGLEQPSPLAIEGITEDTSDGEVAQRYRATIKQLEGYSQRLRSALDRYDQTNAAYDELRDQFMKQKELDGFDSSE